MTENDSEVSSRNQTPDTPVFRCLECNTPVCSTRQLCGKFRCLNEDGGNRFDAKSPSASVSEVEPSSEQSESEPPRSPRFAKKRRLTKEITNEVKRRLSFIEENQKMIVRALDEVVEEIHDIHDLYAEFIDNMS